MLEHKLTAPYTKVYNNHCTIMNMNDVIFADLTTQKIIDSIDITNLVDVYPHVVKSLLTQSKIEFFLRNEIMLRANDKEKEKIISGGNGSEINFHVYAATNWFVTKIKSDFKSEERLSFIVGGFMIGGIKNIIKSVESICKRIIIHHSTGEIEEKYYNCNSYSYLYTGEERAKSEE